jgi:shikimate dehydrogenase
MSGDSQGLTRRRAYAVVGGAVVQSLSPPMQRAAFRAAGVNADYVARTIAAEELPAALPSLRADFAGLNVTMPLKEPMARLMDELSPAARVAASVNTVAFGPDGAFGDSTDGAGFMAALARAGLAEPARALIVGTGGAARAVAAALAAGGAVVDVVGRNEAAGGRLARDLEDAVGSGGNPAGLVRYAGRPDTNVLAPLLRGADLLVNATPAGGSQDTGGSPIPDDVALDAGTAVFDLVYRPRRTPLLRRAAAAGCPTVEGIEMLIEQGARSFELWTGLPAPVDVMREAADRALDATPTDDAPARDAAAPSRGGR